MMYWFEFEDKMTQNICFVG